MREREKEKGGEGGREREREREGGCMGVPRVAGSLLPELLQPRLLQGSGFRAEGSGFRVWGSGFGV
jgi:hypothetical protein